MRWDVQTIEVTTHLGASPAQVWPHISTMRGVNAELSPWIRMSCPPALAATGLEKATPGVVLLRSVLLLFKFLPFDVHFLRLTQVRPGSGFLEESYSLLQRRWRHERILVRGEPVGTVLTDRVEFEPRLPGLGLLMGPVIAAIFRHRHRRLAAYFGRVRG